MNVNVTMSETQDYDLAQQKQSAATGNCEKCGTELRLGAEFCHICGRWVFGSNFSRLISSARNVAAQTGIEAQVLICLLVAAVFAAISLFVGIRMTPKTFGEWQVIQFWRIEWLLGTIVVLLFGVLLKRST